MNIKNDNFIVITKHDILTHYHHKPYWDIDIQDSVVPRDKIADADLIIFKDRYNIKVLKNRFNNIDYIVKEFNVTDSREYYQKLKRLDPFSVKSICGKQQKMLSEMIDEHRRYNFKTEWWWIIVETLQRCWYETKFTSDLNTYKEYYKHNQIQKKNENELYKTELEYMNGDIVKKEYIRRKSKYV